MTNSTTKAQMHVRLSRYLKGQVMNLTVHPRAIDEALDKAMANGWRDAEWLATYAMEGIGHESVKNPAAVFVYRLNEAAAMPCPVESTPEPPSITELRRRKVIVEHTPHPCPPRARQRINQAIGRRTA